LSQLNSIDVSEADGYSDAMDLMLDADVEMF
jgi:hypothetical protein